MALTGLLNGIFMVGSFRALLTSAYGQVLVCKLILFVAMIGFGAWNLFLLKPRIAVDLPTVNIPEQKSAALHCPSRRIAREFRLEAGQGVLTASKSRCCNSVAR